MDRLVFFVDGDYATLELLRGGIVEAINGVAESAGVELDIDSAYVSEITDQLVGMVKAFRQLDKEG